MLTAPSVEEQQVEKILKKLEELSSRNPSYISARNLAYADLVEVGKNFKKYDRTVACGQGR